MEIRKLTPGEYCEGLLDICQFLHCEMKYFLECDNRFHGGAKTYWCNMREGWKKMNLEVTEEDIEIYGRVLSILRNSVYKEFSRLKYRKLSAPDRIIVITKRLLDIVREVCPEDFRFKKILDTVDKGNTRLFDNIRNPGKNDSLYVFSNKVRDAIAEGKCGKYALDDFSLYPVEHPKPKKLELYGEKTVISDVSEEVKRKEIKF